MLLSQAVAMASLPQGVVGCYVNGVKWYKAHTKFRSPTTKEIIMSKGQIRSNKEKKKPKAAKTPATGATTTKGGLPPIKIPGGKG